MQRYKYVGQEIKVTQEFINRTPQPINEAPYRVGEIMVIKELHENGTMLFNSKHSPVYCDIELTVKMLND